MIRRTILAVAGAAAFALAGPARAQTPETITISEFPITRTGISLSGNTYQNGSFLGCMEFCSIRFAAPVSNVSFSYNFFGVVIANNRYLAEAPDRTQSQYFQISPPMNFNAWTTVNVPLITITELVFFSGIRVGFGIDDIRFTTPNPEVFAVPGPLAGAGVPALLGLAGIVAWRRRRYGSAV